MRQAVITGYEAVSAFGLGADALWSGLIEGRNGIRRIERFNASTLPINIAGDVPPFSPDQLGLPADLTQPQPESRCALFTLWCVNNALRAAGLNYRSWTDPRAVGVFMADRETVSGYLPDTAGYTISSMRDDWGRVDYTSLLKRLADDGVLNKYNALDPERSSRLVQRKFGIEGPNVSIGTACASGNDSIGQAAQYVVDGDIDIAIAGGCFELDLYGMIGFTRLEALTQNPDPDIACRPFDKERSGFVMASGCGTVIVEELEHALKRGAPILGVVAGYGNCCDAYRATDPHPEAEGAFRALSLAMRRAGVNPEDVDYVAAHGTSTKLNDRSETIAIKRALKDRAKDVPVSASKSMIGHTIMAAGAIQGIIALKTIETGIVHPTRNLRTPDPECDLNYVPQVATKATAIDVVASNSFGFGGQNSCLIFSRYMS